MFLPGLLLILASLALGLAAFMLLRRGNAERDALGLPAGHIVSDDTRGWKICLRPLYSSRYNLAGKPDYLVQVGRSLVPIEIKPGRTAGTPYASDILQLGAYLLLVEEETGKRPPHGLLRYREQTFKIPHTPALRNSVLACLDEMRSLRTAKNVAPQHDEPQRCLHCGFRERCDERLA